MVVRVDEAISDRGDECNYAAAQVVGRLQDASTVLGGTVEPKVRVSCRLPNYCRVLGAATPPNRDFYCCCLAFSSAQLSTISTPIAFEETRQLRISDNKS